MNIDRRLLQNMEWLLIGSVLALTGIGFLNLYSALYDVHTKRAGPLMTWQTIWVVVGWIVLFLTLLPDYRILERLAYPLYWGTLFLLVVVLKLGRSSLGARRWIALGPVSVQPSELMKVALVIALARYFQYHWFPRGARLRDLLFPILLCVLPLPLVLMQPDLGTGIVIALVGASILLFAGIQGRSLAGALAAGAVAVPLVWRSLKTYQRNRIRAFLDPNFDPQGAGYHILQSKIAVGSGRLWGKGFLHGTQTQAHFLPEQHTDFIFSVLAEEWGLLGAGLVVLLYALLIRSGLQIAAHAKERFGAVLAFGCTAVLFWHVIINIGMVLGVLPVVGITLPLMSYGGTSILTIFFCVGVLLNVGMRRYMF